MLSKRFAGVLTFILVLLPVFDLRAGLCRDLVGSKPGFSGDYVVRKIPELLDYDELLELGAKIFARGPGFFDVATDSLSRYSFPEGQSLLIHFPEDYAKSSGEEPLKRHSQPERAIYQTISTQYKAGDTEFFVTILMPHDRSATAEFLIPKFKRLPVSSPGGAVGIETDAGGQKAYLCVNLDFETEIEREISARAIRMNWARCAMATLRPMLTFQMPR